MHNDEVEQAAKLLPAWFVPRMMQDEWVFGLLLITGQVLVIYNLSAVHQAADGTIWLDVQMEEKEKGRALEPELGDTPSRLNYLFSPTKRTTASINAAHVVAAFELAST
jgi:hypothetical protein